MQTVDVRGITSLYRKCNVWTLNPLARSMQVTIYHTPMPIIGNKFVILQTQVTAMPAIVWIIIRL